MDAEDTLRFFAPELACSFGCACCVSFGQSLPFACVALSPCHVSDFKRARHRLDGHEPGPPTGKRSNVYLNGVTGGRCVSRAAFVILKTGATNSVRVVPV